MSICAACPHPADCAVGRCIDVVLTEQAAQYGSLQNVRIMRKAQAHEAMAQLKAGAVGRKLAKNCVVSTRKLRMHCAIYPSFGAHVDELLKQNAKASHVRRMAWKRAKTHCVHGHEYTPENTSIKFNGTRQCKACNRINAKTGKVMSDADIAAVTTKLAAGIPLSWIAGNNGPDRSHYVVNFQAVNRARREHPEFGAFVASAIADANSRGQARRYQRVQTARRRQDTNDYWAIRALVPTYLPDHVRDDITQSVMLAMLEGSIQRAEIRDRIASFVTDHNRMFPTKFAKFGNAQLLSLDAVLYADGNATRHDTVSEGLWS